MTNPREHLQSVIDSASLPDELLQFLRRDSYSLLIKGSVATGKTILALTILRALKMRRNYLYISTRISPRQLFKNHVWLGEFLKAEIGPSQGPDSAMMNVPASFVDARLDEPTLFFERVTNELMDVQAPLIIIDTWDSIGETMEKEALLSNVRVLQTWRERAGARIIFITEDPDDETLDPLVDGVVTLKRDYVDDRVVRLALLSKLHGIRIDRPSCIFTLHDGIFQSFDRYHPFSLTVKQRALDGSARTRTGPQAANPGHFAVHSATGNDELDNIFEGKLPVGTVVHLELGPRTNSKVAVLFMNEILASSGENEKVILFKQFEGMDLNYSKSNLRIPESSELVVSPQDFGSRVSTRSSSVRSSIRMRAFEKEILKVKREHPHRVIFVIMGSDLVSTEEEDETNIDIFAKFMRTRINLSVIISRGEEKIRKNVDRIADVYLRIVEMNGTLVLEPQIPWAEFFAFVMGDNAEKRSVSFVPIE